MWPAWPSAPAGAQQPWPFASWRPCGGNSQHPSTTLASASPPGPTPSSSSRGVGTWQEALWSRVSSWPEQHEAKHTGAGIGRDSALAMYSTIQKMKWHFNHGSASQMESSVAKVQEELGFQPPVVLSLEDADAAHSLANGHAPVHTEPAPHFRMEPVTTLGVLSLVLNIMCAALNLIRGVHLAERSLQVAQEEIGNILAFLVPFVACIFQCYLYLFYSPARTAKVLLMLLSICLGNVYLHGLRSLWQILFHVGVAFLSSHQILTRQLQEKQSDCGV